MRRFVLFFCLFSLLLPAALAEETTVTYYEAPKQIVISFAGDCTLGCTAEQRWNTNGGFEAVIEREGMAYPFAKVKEIFDNDDLTVVNLEGVFANSEAGRVPKKHDYNFRGPTSYVDILKLGGVDAVSFANNHVMDYDMTGFNSTVNTLEAAGVPWFGSWAARAQTYVYEKDGIKIGFAAVYYSEYNGNRSLIREACQELKDQKCDVIVACLHGGTEYTVRHDDNIENTANTFIKYGADVVVCHHPHTLQGMRVQDGRTCLWSLANFVFGGNPRIRENKVNESINPTMIAQFTFSFDENNKYLGHQLNIIPCHMSSHDSYNDYQPCLVTGADAAEVIRAVQRDVTPRSLVVRPYMEGVGALQDFVPAPLDR